MRSVLFHRNFKGFTGGHLKVWDYFTHVMASPRYLPRIYFSSETVWDDTNPWHSLRSQALKSRTSIRPDVLFIAGLDWLVLGEMVNGQSSPPIINLIQGVRHGQADDPRFQFLRYKAIRICVSEQVKMALTASERLNGPVYVIPNGIDRRLFPIPKKHDDRKIDFLVVGLKQQRLGLQVATALREISGHVELVRTRLARPQFLERLTMAKVTIFLPYAREGFYLPALEGMAAGTLVICPDCVGNREYCAANHNCLQPPYSLGAISEAAAAALQLPASRVSQLLSNAKSTAWAHDIHREREAFLGILHNIDQLW